MERPEDATHVSKLGHYYKADPMEDLNWLKRVDGAWVQVGTVPAGTLAQLTPPAQNYMTTNLQNMFVGLGGNWRWGSVDYRGVARVHTFEPQFSASGRVQVPADLKGNSATAEAFDVNPVPAGWQPLVITRDMRAAGIKCVPTDRFGTKLPVGADPVQAADVVQGADPVAMILDNQKYDIKRTEQCSCYLTSSQVGELLRTALGIDSEQDITVVATNEGGVVGLSVEWRRSL